MSRDNDLIKVIHTTCNEEKVKIQGFLSTRRMLINKLPTPIILLFPYGSAGEESAHNTGDLGGEDALEKGKATQLQYSALENSMDLIVHGVAQSQTQLSDFKCNVCLPVSYLSRWAMWQPTYIKKKKIHSFVFY